MEASKGGGADLCKTDEEKEKLEQKRMTNNSQRGRGGWNFEVEAFRKQFPRAFYGSQSDKKVLFADTVLKFTSTGKMKRRILFVTDFAFYIVDPESGALKRRIALASVEKLCLSELSDNLFAIIIPTEYDLLMAITQKTEIVTILVDATKSSSTMQLLNSLKKFNLSKLKRLSKQESSDL
ncbi:hypothetical protein K7X08_025023 [Anisodus acutangulus]|uniref:TH1 domain-containing protein n=1 Tax=Anisodus acutangulus TaxID=402998 RepID=A0A9Q1RFL1_9SOLA|nr:hypothetical protein K7X08_025023 [Anisodus acutangulus]